MPPRTRQRAGEPVVVPFTIAIDTRESAPWSFDGLLADANKQCRPLLVGSERKHLLTGDYSIVGREHEITIERKSIEDLYGTFSGRRDNFKAEHERMAAMVDAGGYACVIVEAPLATVLQPQMTSGYSPKSVFRSFIRWSMRYRVPWHYVEGRALAEVLAFRLLDTWHQFKEDAE